MNKPVQERTLRTRARLIDAAQEVIAEVGYEGLRVEEVVRRAGVAKGTFFAHFRDKDVLMDQLIGARIDAIYDQIAASPTPESVADVVATMAPLWQFMTCERYVFDVILRHSGAAALAEIGPITQTFIRHDEVISAWMAADPFRRDISPQLAAEGLQAFAIQAMALHFCAAHCATPLIERMETYLNAWLRPGAA